MLNDLTGSTIGRYQLIARLGRGGMGEVYKARDTALKRPVAVKRLIRSLSEDENARHRFLKEAQHAAQLNHQHIAAVYDVLEAREEVFLVMEYVEGLTLRETLSRPLDLDSFLDIATQSTQALVAAHEQGIIHRDVKPSNIMLTVDGKVKILDFGVARELPRSLEDATTQSHEFSDEGGVQGTPAYMAPQVLLGKKVDPRADIFSMGIVFYELLTGHHPFLEETVAATADRILHATPVPILRLNPKVPELLEQTVFKMLAKDPDNRYASAADLLVDLQHLKKVQTGEIPDWVPPAATWRWKLRLPLTALMAAVLLVTILFLASMWRDKSTPVATLPADPTVALLPFEADTSDLRDAAFARGLTRALNEQLSSLAPDYSFAVVPADLARGRGIETLKEIASELGANLALSGKLTQQGSSHHLDMELIEEASGLPVATVRATANLGDALSLEYEVLERTLQLLGAEMEPGHRRMSAQLGTDNASAYHLYLRGRGLLEDPEGVAGARDQFQEALSLDSSFNQARVALGSTRLRDLEDPDAWAEAERLCSVVAEEDPEVVSSHLCLADVWQLRGDQEKEIGYVKTAHYHDFFNPVIVRRLYYAYRGLGRTDKIPEVEAIMRQAIERQPDFWRWHSLLGVLLYHSSRYSEAIEEMKQVVALAPRYYRSLDNLGACYAELGQWAETSQVLEQSIAIQPGATAYNNLGTAYFYQGQFKRAVELFQSALVQGFAGDYLLHGNLGDSLFWAPGEREKARQHHRKAAQMAKQALAESPSDPTILGRLAIYHAMLSERESAYRYLEEAIRLSPEEAEMQFRAAQVYQRFGETDRVIRSLKRAFELGLLKEKALHHPLFEEVRQSKELMAIITQ